MNKTTIIIIVVVVLLLCCCAASGIGAFFLLQSDDNGDGGDKTSSSTTSKQSESTTTTTVVSDTLPYTNYEYGFSLEFPKSWEGYTVTSTQGMGQGYEVSYSYNLESSSQGEIPLFTITIYSQNDWDPMYEELGMETIIGQDNEYVYAFSQMNGIPPQDLEDAFDEIEDIKDSFEMMD